ncbi:hypothetical protein BDD12DRAFT_441375 [Trichophaea hybrida]|nr:hypothetical protein BDD12DRAFT_441375 [Trichophaea hybrida]
MTTAVLNEQSTWPKSTVGGNFWRTVRLSTIKSTIMDGKLHSATVAKFAKRNSNVASKLPSRLQTTNGRSTERSFNDHLIQMRPIGTTQKVPKKRQNCRYLLFRLDLLLIRLRYKFFHHIAASIISTQPSNRNTPVDEGSSLMMFRSLELYQLNGRVNK